MAENQANQVVALPSGSGMPAVEERLSRLAIDAAMTGYGMPLTAPSWAIQRARALLPVIEASAQGAPQHVRVTILERLADHTATPDALKSGDVKRIAAFWGAYHADLGHVPAAILSRACGEWRRSGERFYPTSGQLLSLCKQDEEWRRAGELRKGLSRLATAMPDRGDNFRAMTDEESMELFRKKLAALKASVDAERAENEGKNSDRAREIERTGSLLRRVPSGEAT